MVLPPKLHYSRLSGGSPITVWRTISFEAAAESFEWSVVLGATQSAELNRYMPHCAISAGITWQGINAAFVWIRIKDNASG